MDFEGYWFLARESLLEIFGERTAAILQQLQQLKYELSMLQRNPATVDPEKLVKRFRNEVLHMTHHNDTVLNSIAVTQLAGTRRVTETETDS